MTRRILPPNPADVLRSHHERLERLERLLQQPPEPDPPPPAGGEGGSCTHIWGGYAAQTVDDWDESFGAWRGALGLEVEIPTDGQVHVTGTLYMDDSSGFDSYSIAPWLGDSGIAGKALGPLMHGTPGETVPLTWVASVSAGAALIGFVVRISPASASPLENPSVDLPISIVWSECGFGTNVEYPPL